MAVMIACSPSTGSSLLRRLLNRHEKLFCGSETHLLCKEELYSDWSSYKYRILNSSIFGLRDKAWAHFRGIILDEEYPISKSDLKHFIDRATSFEGFLTTFFQNVLQKTSKAIWLEKTPSNALCASLFLEQIEHSSLIHMTRDPYDTIASLTNRGMSLYDAACIYLLNTSSLLSLNDKSNVHLVKYESLVNDPSTTLKAICDFLNVAMDPSMMDTTLAQGGIDHMAGWRYKETAEIGQASVNRYDSLDRPRQERICHAFDALILRDKRLPGIKEICHQLGYEYRSSNANKQYRNELQLARRSDGLKRLLKLSYFNIFNQAFDINNE